ncbi:MAG: NUDIX hydrolase [Halobacteria archaeon]|nr:NUDIX hydrolase [Halobacteria archaeon]
MSHNIRSIYEGKVITLNIESLSLPNGKPLDLEVVRHPGGAAVVALDDAGRVCLLHQYRHAGGGWLWELPAGKIDPGEAPQSTAQRELAEEAGLQAGDWQKLGQVLTTPGFCDEVIHLYLARRLETVPAQHHEHELIEIHWLPLVEALRQVRDGTIHDAKTMLGLLLAAGVRAP